MHRSSQSDPGRSRPSSETACVTFRTWRRWPSDTWQATFGSQQPPPAISRYKEQPLRTLYVECVCGSGCQTALSSLETAATRVSESRSAAALKAESFCGPFLSGAMGPRTCDAGFRDTCPESTASLPLLPARGLRWTRRKDRVA